MDYGSMVLFSHEGFKIVIVLSLSFLIGLEREERRSHGEHYYFGGVRTFPLIGLLGYAVAFISGKEIIPILLGLAVVGAFMLVSYMHKISTNSTAGVTSEVTGLIIYLVGVLVQQEYLWVATTLVVAGLILLELKVFLETLATRIPGDDVATFTKFLLITAVILPIVPNRTYTIFQLNPFKTWLVVVAVSSVSYGSYVLKKLSRGRGGLLLSALLGGAYSSTITTVVISKKARHAGSPNLFASAILIASGVMYLRIEVLIALFNARLGAALFIYFLILGVTAVIIGLGWSYLPGAGTNPPEDAIEQKNPLELKTAFLFTAIFVAVSILTWIVIEHMGIKALYSLAGIMGVTDVVPFIMGLTQVAGKTATISTAVAATIIATASNNLVKGLYALIFADRKTGLRAALALFLLSSAGLLPLLFV